VGIAEEVVARLHGEVAGGEDDTEAAILRLAGGDGPGGLGAGSDDGGGGRKQEGSGEKEFAAGHETLVLEGGGTVTRNRPKERNGDRCERLSPQDYQMCTRCSGGR